MKPVTVSVTIGRPRNAVYALVEPAGLADRLQGPILHAYLKRQNGRALERLKELLGSRGSE